MIESRSHRLLAICILLSILTGLLLWAGTFDPASDRNVYPDEETFLTNYDASIGSLVETDGTVLTTDPLVIEVSPDGRPTVKLTLTNVDPTTVAVGDEIDVFGTLEPDTTVEVIRSTIRSPWEYYYMYTVSFLAGLWTLGRFRRHWTLNTDTLSFTPREDS